MTEPHRYATWGPAPRTPEEDDRMARVTARAKEVFGNSTTGGVWLARPDFPTFSDWGRPWEIAQKSEEGCLRVLAELDRLSLTVVPDLHDPVAAAMKHRAKRRRR